MADDTFRWLVTFASPYHLAWFLLSAAGVAAALGIDAAFRLSGKAHAWALLGHAVVAIEAIIHEMIGAESAVFSVHCIWFNALMAFLHWRLLVRAATRADGANDNDP